MRFDHRRAAGFALAAVLGASLAGNAWQHTQGKALASALHAQRQREMADIADAMSGIEVNLSKLLVAAGAAQSVSLLSETALLAQHVESGLSRLPLHLDTAADAMKFAGQMGQYAMTLAAQVSAGSMLSGEDKRQITALLDACRALSEYLSGRGQEMYTLSLNEADMLLAEEGEEPGIPYPSLIYDGPFSDGRISAAPKGLTGERVTREQARAVAARAAGTTADRVSDAADSGGAFEAFGFRAQTGHGEIDVQITGQGGHVLWMMPEEAAFSAIKEESACLDAAQVWLADMGFGLMEPCFTQAYDGMFVVNFAAVQDGVLLYPDQVKVQVSMETGTVVGAECTQYLSHHTHRESLEPLILLDEAQDMVSDKLHIRDVRLCLIPDGEGETLCWEFVGEAQGAQYRVYIDGITGEAAEILRVMDTPQGEMAM